MKKKENILSVKYPEIAKEWDYDKNDCLTPDDVTYGSSKKVWWKCELDHEYNLPISKRTSRGQGCSECKKINHFKENSVEMKYPELLDIWDYDKNKLDPSNVTYGSNSVYWWTCDNNHSYKASIYNLKRGSRCPFCSGSRATIENNFLKNYPEISKEWDYDKNKLKPSGVTPKSHRKIWWKCSNGHSFKMMCFQRATGQGCPVCANGPHSRICLEWLNAIMEIKNIHIEHAMNGGEKVINVNGKNYRVDGYCEVTNTIYEFFGCYFHGHSPDLCISGYNYNRNKMNKKIKKTFGKLYDNSLERIKILKSQGFNVIYIWECDYKASKKN